MMFQEVASDQCGSQIIIQFTNNQFTSQCGFLHLLSFRSRNDVTLCMVPVNNSSECPKAVCLFWAKTSIIIHIYSGHVAVYRKAHWRHFHYVASVCTRVIRYGTQQASKSWNELPRMSYLLSLIHT